MNSFDEVFEHVKRYCLEKGQIPEVAVKLWIDALHPVDLSGTDAVFTIQSDFQRSVILSNYEPLLKEAFRNILGFDVNLVIRIEEEFEPEPTQTESTGSEDLALRNQQLEKSFEGANYEYTFSTFIVGRSNEFAYAACTAVAKEPGKSYNPLFIYGPSGLGKTHLMHAIGHFIQDHFPNMRMLYLPSEMFTNELVSAIKNNKNVEFRNRFRNVDVLMLDDIQFIAGKESTQEEFFHTFNNIYEAGNQIVITSDRPPMEMAQLDDRLRTRFEWGLMADIQPPDLETRMAITRNKAAQLGLILSDDAVEYIATNITSNIRQLEGVIKRLTAYKEILDDVITIDSVKRAIKDVIRIGTYTPTPDIIIRETARYYSLKEEDLRGQNRSKNMTMARQVSMYLMRSLTGLSLKDIGTHYEDRNHATVLSSIRKVEQLLKNDPSMAGTVRDITSNINSV